nr:hypothetical protein [uncultured Acetatifactor sp.]
MEMGHACKRVSAGFGYGDGKRAEYVYGGLLGENGGYDDAF